MKISELCRMIEVSIHAEKYPLDQEQKNFAKLVKITNKSESDDLKSNDIKIEVRIQNLFVLNNYVSDIEHLPGIIEMDILDSFKMICRRAQRVSSDFITEIAGQPESNTAEGGNTVEGGGRAGEDGEGSEVSDDKAKAALEKQQQSPTDGVAEDDTSSSQIKKGEPSPQEGKESCRAGETYIPGEGCAPS